MSKLRIVTVVCFTAILLLLGLMMFRLMQFENATSCQLTTTVSRSCITNVEGTIISKVKRKHEYQNGNNSTKTGMQDGAVIKTANGNLTLWSEWLNKNFQPGQSVKISSWNGHYIEVNNGKYSAPINDWHESWLKLSLIWLINVVIGIILVVVKYPIKEPKRKALMVLFNIAWFVICATTSMSFVPLFYSGGVLF